MLNGVFGPLWDIRDGEAFARRAVDLTLRNSGLSETSREDILQGTIFALWRLSGLDENLRPIKPRPIGAYDPGIGQSFSKFAYQRLPLRSIDELRKFHRTKWQFAEHTYERTLPEFVSFDAELDSPVGSGSMDPAAHSDPDLRGVLERGDSAAAWQAAPMGERPARRTEKRAA